MFVSTIDPLVTMFLLMKFGSASFSITLLIVALTVFPSFGVFTFTVLTDRSWPSATLHSSCTSSSRPFLRCKRTVLHWKPQFCAYLCSVRTLQASARGLASGDAVPLRHASRRPTSLISMDWTQQSLLPTAYVLGARSTGLCMGRLG